MKKYILFWIVPFVLLFHFQSCENTFETNGMTEGVLGLGIIDEQVLTSYTVGEDYEIGLVIQHGGLSFAETTIKLEISQALVDSINEFNETNYQLLPADCYTLLSNEVVLSKEEELYRIPIVYSPEKIEALGGYDNLKYILPIKLVSLQGMTINKNRSDVAYLFRVSEPVVSILNADVHELNLASVNSFEVKIGTTFTNKWDIECFLGHKESEVEEYNRINNTYYSLLSKEDYTASSEILLPSGTNAVSSVFTVSDKLLPGNYMLPVELEKIIATLDGVETTSIQADSKKKSYYLISKQGVKINKSDWSVVSVSSEEANGEGANGGKAIHMIDGNAETFWHSKWQGGSVALPHEMVFDMKKTVQIAQVELLPRGRSSNNPIKLVQFETSMDNVTWESIGEFAFENSDVALLYAVKSTKARYIKMIIPNKGGNGNVAAIRELDVRGTII